MNPDFRIFFEGHLGLLLLQRGLPTSGLYVVFWSIFFTGSFAGLITMCHLVYKATKAVQTAAAETRRAAQSSLLSQLVVEYSSPGMTAAMRALFRWRDDHKADFAEQYQQLVDTRAALGDELDNCRRMVFRYFHKVKTFCQAELLDPNLVEKWLIRNDVAEDLVLNILEPLETVHGKAFKKRYREELFEYYREKFEMARGS